MADSKKKTVTYLGPVTKGDPTTIYRIPGTPGEGGDIELPRGVAVEVTAAQAKALRDDELHDFKMGELKPGEIAPWPEYDDLTAEQVVERVNDPNVVGTFTAAEAVVEYEKANEKRKTVLDAAEAQAENFRPVHEAQTAAEAGVPTRSVSGDSG